MPVQSFGTTFSGAAAIDRLSFLGVVLGVVQVYLTFKTTSLRRAKKRSKRSRKPRTWQIISLSQKLQLSFNNHLSLTTYANQSAFIDYHPFIR